MKKRNLQIFFEIIKNPNLKSGDLENKLHITRRQLTYALSQINQDLADQQLPKIERTPRGEFITSNKITELFNLEAVTGISHGTYREEKERILITCLYLLTSDELISLTHIYDLNKVSRTTAFVDLKSVEKFLDNRDLQLKYTRKLGYFIKGTELTKRNLLNYLVTQLLSYDDVHSVVEQLGRVSIEPVIHFIHNFEHVQKITYSDESFNFLMLIISMNVTRNLSHVSRNTHYFEHQIDDTQEFVQIRQLIPNNWITSNSDAEWLIILLLSANTIHCGTNITNETLINVLHVMVDKFEQRTFIKIVDKNDFVTRLLTHLRPAIFRVRYNLHLQDIGIDQVVISNSRHHFLMETINIIIEPLEKLTGKTFPTDERNLIAFYFAGELEKFSKLHTSKERAAVVCTNGLIVSKLMIQNLRRLFPDISFLSATSAREFEHFSGDYNLVFTTIPLKTDARQYIIHPLLSETEQAQLRYQVLNDIGVKNIQLGVEELTSIIRKSAKILDYKELRKSLHQFLADQTIAELPKTTQSTLAAFTAPRLIQIGNAHDWQEALKQAIDPLIKYGYVTADWREVLIKETASPENYSFLGMHVAIPHTIPENGVLKNGFSFFVLKEPIIYPNGFKIKMIVPIAVKDTDKHLKAIQELTEIISNKSLLNMIYSSENNRQIYNIFQNYCSQNS
ncbi:BglG family transcription antiterminator [Liquorilactobacillus mali]|uniref:BglG family transcription antiterminator n=1 Tax=Liquorilactobacillus mali TaxID=1618 RepID=UPI000705658B|nr:BglG family transcription antiterminator [Liquorilactobacillus mali]MDN7145443.1 BglG family transcription antiterminator [Liquorilactobacillus mali]